MKIKYLDSVPVLEINSF